MNKKLKSTAVWVPLLIAAAFAIGLVVGSRLFPTLNESNAMSKLATIMKYIDAEYVDEVNTDSIIEASLSDILSKLDPHSVYISADDLESVNSELEGSFSGIGISFNTLSDTITVVEIISDGPSEKAGILAGDRIISINDTVAVGKEWTNEKIISRLRGAKGTKVKLGILRGTSSKPIYFEVTRGDIPVNSVDSKYMISDGVGYVKVNKFGNTTYSEFITALAELQSRGAKSFIIDLRGNSGGFMEMAILMANEFLPAGAPIVSTHGRIPDAESAAYADGTGSFQQSEVVVVIDEYSASASEILAGALQDNDRALVVGRRSFGKGLVQRQIPLPGNSAMRLTRARYYTPSGRCIQKSYTPGALQSYELEISNRLKNGEGYSADSIHIDKSQEFFTAGGRTVYGGGGIIPDVFVPNDTTGISTYYINVFNAGMLQRFAFDYTDKHRTQLHSAKTIDQLMAMLPDDDTLLQSFADFASKNGIPQRWYYINLSRDLIVNELKALIARDVFGVSAFYEVINQSDNSITEAVEAMRQGKAKVPITAPSPVK